jgi:transposase
MPETLLEAWEMITALRSQIEVLGRSLHGAQLTISQQQHLLEQYVRRLYGPRSEKFDPAQLMLLLPLGQPAASVTADAPPAAPPTTTGRAPRHHPHGRLPIPAHLERVVVELEVDEKDRVCPRTGQPMVLIGYDECEKLEYRPGRLFVRVYRRAKYASPDRLEGASVGVLAAPLPDHPIERCKADVGLIAHAIVSKFGDHIPLYRLDGIFAREGVEISRSTLDGWALATADALWPLGQALKKAVLDTDVLFTDDTPAPLLEPGRGKTRKARLWVYVRGGHGPPLFAYDFTLDRRQQRPRQYLGPYRGYVHADAYGGYDSLFSQEGVIEVACWAHVRRRFDEAMTSRPLEASAVLGCLGRVYALEKEVRGEDAEVRRQHRLTHIKPLLIGLFERLAEQRSAALPSEPLRKAIDYALNQRQALLRFLEDGRLEPDNNTAENAIRPIAIGRKNWLFAGSERGGCAAALYLGLIQSCKARQINPWAYFDDVLRRVMSHPVSQLRALLPDHWQPLERDDRGLIGSR